MKSLNQNTIYRFISNLFFIAFLGVFSLGFSQNQIEKQTQKSILLPKKAKVYENIAYKSNNEKPVLLDIYTPRNSSSEKLPVLIYVHGGGWVTGDKTIHADSYIENTILKLVEKNYAVISIEYTLVSETVHFPLPIQDTKDAIRWVRKMQTNIILIRTTSVFSELRRVLILLCWQLIPTIMNLSEMLSFPDILQKSIM